jgi:hypothetical protein
MVKLIKKSKRRQPLKHGGSNLWIERCLTKKPGEKKRVLGNCKCFGVVTHVNRRARRAFSFR